MCAPASGTAAAAAATAAIANEDERRAKRAKLERDRYAAAKEVANVLNRVILRVERQIDRELRAQEHGWRCPAGCTSDCARERFRLQCAPTRATIEAMRRELRLRRYSPRTEAAYLHWVRRYLDFHGRRHPLGLGEDELTTFMTHLASGRGVSASIQTQALSALVFLYRRVLKVRESLRPAYVTFYALPVHEKHLSYAEQQSPFL